MPLFFIFASMITSNDGIILSSAYLPPVSWFRAAMPAQDVFIEAHETYPRQTYRNRCRVMSANGIIALSVPVKKTSGEKKKIKDIEIFYDEPWQRLHWRTIDAAYSNSPFYLYYKDSLFPFYEKKYRFLLDFNILICETIFKLLGDSPSLQLTTTYKHEPEACTDLRNAFSPKVGAVSSNFKAYHQVFEERHGFIPDLSIIDLLFNEGPAAGEYLQKSEI